MSKRTGVTCTILIVCFILTIIGANFYPYFCENESESAIPPKPPPYEYLIPIIQSKQPKLDPTVTAEISKSIYINSNKYQFPAELIVAVIERESSFIPTSTSSAKCIGLMQINPQAHPEKVEGLEHCQLYYIDNNIKIGCQILKEYYDATGGISDALEKYLGANNKGYITDILKNFADSIISKNSNKAVVFCKSEEKM